jgi:hypothetical protein
MYARNHQFLLGLALMAALLRNPTPTLGQETHGVGGKDKDMYFMILFSQDGGWRPRFSHTYAAFVRAHRAGPKDSDKLATHTISWMPATLDVRLLNGPEQGVNLSLKASLDHSVSMGPPISMWGPYQIQKELFERAVRQETVLKEGKLLYKAIDGGVRADGEGLNCFHAVADIDKDRGLLETGLLAYGDEATAMVARHLQRWIVNPTANNDWVADALGLRKYPITRRSLDGRAIAAQK